MGAVAKESKLQFYLTVVMNDFDRQHQDLKTFVHILKKLILSRTKTTVDIFVEASTNFSPLKYVSMVNVHKRIDMPIYR